MPLQPDSFKRMTMSRIHAATHPRFPVGRLLETQVGPIVDGNPTLAIELPGIQTPSLTMYSSQIEKLLSGPINGEYMPPGRRPRDPNRPTVNKEFGEGW